MTSENTLVLLCFIKRRQDLTEDQFYEYWEKIHGPKIAPWALKHGIVGYKQIHTRATIRGSFAAAVPLPLSTVDFDGAVIWEFPSLDTFLSAFSHPYYVNVIAPDEKNFLEKTLNETATVTMGYLRPIVSEGESTVECDDQLALFEQWEREE
ncbi:uncharacterized protein N7515_007130 [Penicillium bovifimosum]|uniref:EthD domain-containing protein n=1 Tax=Penicillium bovifimosum TaxID=126998 RepID=A0A9W9L1D3_9EURO|nr:uncharacterized protein N7515_007130 [Penicillium bovifimosum]KAJ5131091.1 hypothetical protein N7515_007130 [Penicillium bovifimosum]